MAWLIALTEVERWAFGLVIVLFLSLTAHRLSLWRDSRTAKLAAAAKLRSAFAPIFARFQSYRFDKTFFDDIGPDTFLRDQLESQGLAVIEFRQFVSKRKRRAYDDAWQQCYQTETDGVLVSGPHARNGNDAWSVIEDRIHALFRFTET